MRDKNRIFKYTHKAKIGNRGDLSKHSILARLVEHLSVRKSKLPFGYAETHAGRPIYVLERNGEWEDSIGEFYNRLRSLSEVPTDFPNLKPYIDLCLSEPPRAGREYPGSSGLVYQMLKRLDQPYRFFLCDVDPSVCVDLMSYFPQWDQVTVCRGNGFECVQMLDDASLVLVDPAYLDTEDDKKAILKTLRVLDDKNIPVMCWTPRVEPSVCNKRDPAYASYEKDLPRRFGSVSIKWTEAEPKKFWGCHIAVSRDLEEIAQATVDEVLKIMRWSS